MYILNPTNLAAYANELKREDDKLEFLSSMALIIRLGQAQNLNLIRHL